MTDRRTATGTTDLFFERNRFVAFAFAAADAFLEIDCDETITFADGATQWLAGQPADHLARIFHEAGQSLDFGFIEGGLEE